MTIKRILAWAVLPLLLAACSGNQNLDNPARGSITIAADESFRPLVSQLTEAYSGIYPDAHFELVFRPEHEAINMMLRDSARLVFSGRVLSPTEQAILGNRKIPGKAEKLATDGVALIIGKANRDSLITIPELQRIFSGQLTDWKQLKGGYTGPITLVFDNNNSSNLDFMLAKFGVKSVANLRIFTAKSNRDVIDYVRTNPTALGFIGVNWISDGDAPLTATLSRELRVMGVSAKLTPASIKDYFQPFQRDLGLKTYPLYRTIYVLSREAHSGLGGGLINYVQRDAGALIIEKLGLWPAKPYNREVYFK